MEPDLEPGPDALAAWLHDQLAARGYDLSARGGGRRRFAADSGISRATISRILIAQGATEIRVLTQLSRALHVPLGHILIIAGLATARDLDMTPEPGRIRLTPEAAADALGIVDPTQRAVFTASVRALQRSPTAEKPAD